MELSFKTAVKSRVVQMLRSRAGYIGLLTSQGEKSNCSIGGWGREREIVPTLSWVRWKKNIEI